MWFGELALIRQKQKTHIKYRNHIGTVGGVMENLSDLTEWDFEIHLYKRGDKCICVWPQC